MSFASVNQYSVSCSFLFGRVVASWPITSPFLRMRSASVDLPDAAGPTIMIFTLMVLCFSAVSILERVGV
jgi:hypothetical protein